VLSAPIPRESRDRESGTKAVITLFRTKKKGDGKLLLLPEKEEAELYGEKRENPDRKEGGSFYGVHQATGRRKCSRFGGKGNVSPCLKGDDGTEGGSG